MKIEVFIFFEVMHVFRLKIKSLSMTTWAQFKGIDQSTKKIKFCMNTYIF